MRYSVFRIAILSVIFFSGCSKKELPQPNPLNASNTKIHQSGTAVPPFTAPCFSILVNNKISYTYLSEPSKYMLCTPLVSNYNNMLDISCAGDRTYYPYDLVNIYLPDKGSFIGKTTYDVQEVSSPSSSVALISDVRYSIYYSSPVYTGYEGTIYAEYTSKQIIISFCGVKVRNGASTHYLTGQVVIDNNF